MLLSQWSDDRLCDFGHAHSLRAAGGVAIGDHVEGQPDGAFYLEVFGGPELWMGSGRGRMVSESDGIRTVCMAM